MGLTRLAINRPLTMLMIILGLVVMGFRSYTELQVDRYPAVDFPFVVVVVAFPGAGPEDVEDLVVKPIEDAVAGVSGLDEMTSVSQENVGFVVLAFEEGVSGDQAAIDVERQISTMGGQLPEDALEPSIIKADIEAMPIMEIVLNGPQGQDELYQIAEEEIKPRLQAIKGVASVSVQGGRESEIQVQPDPSRMSAFGITLESLQQALGLNNLTFPVGTIDEGRQKTTVRSVGEFTSLEEIGELVVAGGPSPYGGAGGPTISGRDTGGLVYLRQVATIEEGYEDTSSILRYNGVEAVGISVVKTSDSNTIELADQVREAVGWMNDELPPGAVMTIVVDDSEFTRESVEAVQEDLMLAILITGLVMLLFLHTIRSTFIVILAIPTSLISTFIVMWMAGFSLNTMTLLALTLTIGILVDDSIVVLENIERHLQMKKTPRQASLDGRAEIGLAAITITLVDVAVYVPVAFTSGIVGQFFRSYGITIATTVLFSLFVSFTLTPMLASQWLADPTKPKTKPRGLRKVFGTLLWPVSKVWNGFIWVWEGGFTALTNFYGGTIRFVLKNFLTLSLAVLVAVAALAGGFYMVTSGMVGTEFMPTEDDGKFTVDIQMPAGTNLATTDEAARMAEQIILEEVPETTSILTSVGGGGDIMMGGGSGANVAGMTVQVVDKSLRDRSTSDIIEDLRPELNKIPEVSVALGISSVFGGDSTAAIEILISGQDADVLIDLADQTEAVLYTVPGTTDVRNLDAAQAPEVKIVVDRERALDLGLSPAQIAGTLRTALTGADAGSFKQAGATDVDIVLRMDELSRSDLEQLLNIPLGYFGGEQIKLSQVATIERSYAPAVINRTNRQRTLTVTSGVSGRPVGDVTSDVEEALNDNLDVPPGYAWQFSGMTEAQQESFTDMFSALALGILLIYMLLVALFQSWLNPFAIMFSLPVAVVGAFGGLYLTGYTLNLISILGLILLTGIVTKNAILLVDFTNELRRTEGLSRKEALIKAGRLRLRPILMTTGALVFAMLPILLGQGAGAEARAPLAAVVIGGNITSTLLTLLLVPVVYTFLDGGSSFATRILKKIIGSDEPPEAEDVSAPLPQPGAAATALPAEGSAVPSSPQTDPDAA